MRDADLILVLQDGKITESGTHRQLLEKRGYYWQTWCMQYGMTTESEGTQATGGENAGSGASAEGSEHGAE